MTQDWNIREFVKDDVPTVVEINRSTLPENYPESFFIGLHYHAPKAFLIAERNGTIIGYIMCRIERGISSFGKRPVKKGHIVSVAVIDSERRKGMGIDLIAAAMVAMIGYGVNEFFLEVRKSNEAAIGVYEKLGYHVKRVLRGYYRDGEDAYLMVKSQGESIEESEGQLDDGSN